jgi:hypothetical protein
MDYSRSKHQAARDLLGPQLFNQPKGTPMKEPLVVTISVGVKDADGKTVYDGTHAWSGMSEEAEVLLMATLNNAVTNAGLEKAKAKGKV